MKIFEYTGFVKLCDSVCNWWNNYWYTDTACVFTWVLIVLILFGIMIYMFRERIPKLIMRLIGWTAKRIFWTAFVIWVLGVLVYTVGFMHHNLNAFAVLPRAIISSFKMFVASNDLARVHVLLQKDALYMTLFSVLHLVAAFVSFMFVFKVMIHRFKSWNRIRKYKKDESMHNKMVHVFWGICEPAFLLANDIRNKRKSDNIIIFIDIDDDYKECSSRKVSFGFVTNSVTLDENELKRIDLIEGALIDHCFRGPSSVDVSEDNDVFKALKLKDVGAIVENGAIVRNYFLSEDENENIRGALNLMNDFRFKKNKEVYMHIHARKDANNEVFDHYSQYHIDYPQNIRFEIVDSAYLSVLTLKKNDKCLPVNCVKVEANGCVYAPFNSMIVGFGEVGQEAFKFLYEFSVFKGMFLNRTPFRCYAIDSKMNEIEGLIRYKMPEIRENELTLIHTSVNSKKMWNLISNEINRLNYVVVTLNDDMLGLSFGVNLFKYAIRHRDKGLPVLKIVMRCYDNRNEKRMVSVIKSLEKSTIGENVQLDIFGRMEDLYKWDNIVDDITMKAAKEFHGAYENSEVFADEKWNECFGIKAISKVMTDKNVTRFHAIYDINRRINQNVSNALHCRTKMILMGFTKNESPERERLKRYCEFIDKFDALHYDCSDADNELLCNLAITEHERWMASHKLLGFKPGDETDLVAKTHKYLRPWQELDDETKTFDCKVINTTIKIANIKAGKV